MPFDVVFVVDEGLISGEDQDGDDAVDFVFVGVVVGGVALLLQNERKRFGFK